MIDIITIRKNAEDIRKEAEEWKKHLPSAEHRGHIRRFLRSDLTDEEDVASRGYVNWKRLNFAVITAAAAVKRRTNEEEPNEEHERHRARFARMPYDPEQNKV